MKTFLLRYETSIIIKQKSGKFAKNPCNYCGDGVIGGTEECDNQTTADLCSGSTKHYGPVLQYHFENNESLPAEITEVSNKTYSLSFKDSFCASGVTNPFLNYINGNGNNKCFYNKQDASATGWTRQYVKGHYGYCSTIENYNNRVVEVVFQINAPTAGYVGFDYYGDCESGDNGEKIIDGLVVSVDRSDIFSANHASILYDMASGTVSDWTSFKKSVTAGTHKIYFWYVMDKSDQNGLSKFCIDNLKFFDNTNLENVSTRSDNPSDMTCNNSTCKKNSGGACYGTWCGDGTANGSEFCDDGSSNKDKYGNHCNSNCTAMAPYCGDGVVNGSEQCDGNSTDCSNVGDYNQGSASCTESCTWNTSNCSKSSGGGC